MRPLLVAACMFPIACSPKDPVAPDGKAAAYLETVNLMGEWERLALVYGYWDDYEGCTEIANALGERYTREYRCVPTK